MTTDDQQTIFTAVDEQLEDFAQEIESISGQLEVQDRVVHNLNDRVHHIERNLGDIKQDISELKKAFESLGIDQGNSASTQTKERISSIRDLSIGDKVKVINPPRGQDPSATVSGFTRYYAKLTLDSGEVIRRKASNILKDE